MTKSLRLASYFRNFIFGVEDSLVSTVGLLSGIAVAHVSGEIIFLTGIVLIFVEAFSMAVGSFLSEQSAEEYVYGVRASSSRSVVSGVIMFFSYFVSGFIPLFPYLLFPVSQALVFSIVFSVLALFLLGVVGGNISSLKNPLWNGFRIACIGSIAIILGSFAGLIISRFGSQLFM